MKNVAVYKNYFTLTGLILVPNGKLLGQQFGDRYPSEEAWKKLKLGGGSSTVGQKNVSIPIGKIRGQDEEGPGICQYLLFMTPNPY